MRKRSAAFLLITCVILYTYSFCFGQSAGTKPKTKKETPTLDLLLINKTDKSLKSAFDYLMKTQQPNGSWKYDPAITSLVLYSYILQPSHDLSSKNDKALDKGFDFVKTFVKPDGGIYNKEFKNYTTSVCLMALTETGDPKYKTIIENAKKFLIDFQLDENDGIAKGHPFYGGIGYGGDDRPDLSNTQLALEAIKAAETYGSTHINTLPQNKNQAEKEKKPGPHWQKALVFLSRTQNVRGVNDMAYVANDGGFIYETGHYKADRSHSYGSMTYAGLKSLLFAGIDKNDIRVKKALAWICANYTFEENPKFGTASIYYYYMTASKCLALMAEDVITDTAGTRHNWRKDIIEKIISLQLDDGGWVNSKDEYQENIKELSTAYSVIAIKFALKDALMPKPDPAPLFKVK